MKKTNKKATPTFYFECDRKGNMKYGIKNDRGRRITPPLYYKVLPFSEDLAAVLTNSRWGFVNEKGMMVIPPRFKFATSFSQELALVQDTEKWGYINKNGEFVIQPNYDFALPFKEGRAAVSVKTPEGVKWGYIDLAGKLVIPPKFESVRSFSNGLAVATILKDEEEIDGYIDKHGNWAIEPNFFFASDFREGVAPICVDTPDHEHRWGVINTSGRCVLPAFLDYIAPYSEGMAMYYYEGKFGFLDTTGWCRIVQQFTTAQNFRNGLAVVSVKERVNDNWATRTGFIDKNEKFVIQPEFLDAKSFSEGLAPVSVEKNGEQLWGYINVKGKMKIKPKYSCACSFVFGTANVKLPGDKNWSHIDKRGRPIKPSTCFYIRAFFRKLFEKLKITPTDHK